MAEARKRKKVPRYDAFGNYLGDFAEEADAAPAPVEARASSASAPAPAVPAPAPAPPAERVVRPMTALRIPAAVRRAPTGPQYRCGVHTTLLDESRPCAFVASSELELMLHRADRHLLYPPGGLDELRRRDPMRIAQERERAARARRGQMRGADGPMDSTIQGLNIRLDTPELVDEWIRQRKKRFPTAEHVAQKAAAQARGGGRPPATEARARVSPEPAASDADDASDSDTSSTTSGTASSSSSDMDFERDAVSSKVPPPEVPAAREPRVCRYYLQGTCTFGAACRQSHGAARERVRAVPRAPARNPFEPPDLLRKMLGREIAQHVDALAQLIRFVLDNDMLAHVERRAGDAAAQAAARARVVPLDGAVGAPAPAPALRALVDLRWPEEPDPLVYLDPLRRTDPKPLRLAELEALATDAKLRAILTPSTPLHPHGAVNEALREALRTWDALPTARHRDAALELVLGVGAQSPVYAHEAYTPPTQRARGVPADRRGVSEAELLRLGLRIGPDEVV
ncbi:hypothetical protein MBRA1_001382 [Malassezia brasiliensis]|uniref:C3H1-type domain-containing protein n=1 Tax=Malassezia brasiliensis TaxID=1821822 RepID=A0AAF0DSQ2_9BASI|nr:hypothetical protein MBRA1_001382 [Malassezia brasiliensis]